MLTQDWKKGILFWVAAPGLAAARMSSLIASPHFKEQAVLGTGAVGRSGRKARTAVACGRSVAVAITAAVFGLGTSAAGASSALGTPHPAILPAVTIGLISDSGGSAGVAT